jgi:hypothetical protein
MIADLLEDHEAIIRTLRRDLETAAEPHRDMGTNDFLTGLMERHEKNGVDAPSLPGEPTDLPLRAGRPRASCTS